MNQKVIKIAHYIEKLSKYAKPYYEDNEAKLKGLRSAINDFPKSPGIYLILRKVNLHHNDYTAAGVNTKSPLILYIGKTTANRTIRERLDDHFGGKKMSYQGSQFRKFLFQVIQDETALKRVLWSDDTLIASVAIEENDQVISDVENLAIQVFKPRFNIKD